MLVDQVKGKKRKKKATTTERIGAQEENETWTNLSLRRNRTDRVGARSFGLILWPTHEANCRPDRFRLGACISSHDVHSGEPTISRREFNLSF